MNRATFKLILRHKNEHDVGVLAAQMFINGEKLVLSTHLSVHSCNWDAKGQRVIAKAKSPINAIVANDYNLILNKVLQNFNQIVFDFRLRGQHLTKEQMKQLMGAWSGELDFHTWAETRIIALVGIHAKRTIDHYRVTFRALKAFAPVLQYADLTPEFVDRFEMHLIRDKRLGVNARAKYHKHLKTFTRELSRTVPMPNLYAHFKVRQVLGDKVYLIRQEVQMLTRLYDSEALGTSLQASLRMFLFSCQTGLRFQDLITVKNEQIQQGYLTFMPLKTARIEKRIDVPLSDEAIRLIANATGCLFDKISNAHYGRNLKEIARCAAINKKISAHVGRHTFATGYIARGGNVHVLQRILGHSKIETTMIYVHLSKQSIEEERHIVETIYDEPVRP